MTQPPKPKAPPRPATEDDRRRAMTDQQRQLRDWTDLRGRWISSGWTGYDQDGNRLPPLPPKP